MNELQKFKDMSIEEAQAYLDELNACSHDCSTCGADCASKHKKPAKRVIAVISGKGGTGKSTVTVLLAKALLARGVRTAILDADISGAAIPHLVGMNEPVLGEAEVLAPAVSPDGIPVVSMALIAEDSTEPVLWAGLDQAKAAVYFFEDTKWGDPDVLLVDMPSGSGDIPLEYFTTMPFDSSLIVAIPGAAAHMPILRAANLAEMLMVPVMGMVENFAAEGFSTEALYPDLPLLASLSYDPVLRRAADEGKLGSFNTDAFDFLARAIEETM